MARHETSHLRVLVGGTTRHAVLCSCGWLAEPATSRLIATVRADNHRAAVRPSPPWWAA